MVTHIRSSASDPLRIAEILTRDGRGMIGMTLCPGKRQAAAMTGAWARDLETDIEAIAAWGAQAVVSLITSDEMRELSVQRIGQVVGARGLTWLHLPIDDYAIPGASFEEAWPAASAMIHQILDRGGKVLVHCKGGLGRAGTVAAMLLVERGEGPSMALCRIREARPGAVETDEQEQYVICHALHARALPSHG